MDNGLASFRSRLLGLPEAIRRSIGPELVIAAEDMAATARQLAPERTGALMASIAVTGPGEQTPPYSQPGGSMVVPENAAAVTVGGPKVRYAHLVEYGTTKTAAQPYFWPAYRLHKEATKARIAAAVKRAIGGQA